MQFDLATARKVVETGLKSSPPEGPQLPPEIVIRLSLYKLVITTQENPVSRNILKQVYYFLHRLLDW